MDFGSLLHVAQKKVETSKNGIKYYSTKFEPPKKEQRASKKLSANIQKFLARKEAEEKKKAEEERIKKLELLALRSQDTKSKKRIQAMLKKTKSANQSVIEDAIDKQNTAVTLAGPSQPDEDDYGYESQEAAAYYAKMMERYSNMPEEDKFTLTKKKPVSLNLTNTKDRVKAALLKEKEDELLPHKRKRKRKSTEEENPEKNTDDTATLYSSYKNQEPDSREREQKPKRPPAPPPLNFNELLKIAEKKQFEPIVIEPKKPDPEGPLLTKKQRKEYEKEKAWREAREIRMKAQQEAERVASQKSNEISKTAKSSSGASTSKQQSNESEGRIPKINKIDSKSSKINNNHSSAIAAGPTKQTNYVPQQQQRASTTTILERQLTTTTSSSKLQSSSKISDVRKYDKQPLCKTNDVTKRPLQKSDVINRSDYNKSASSEKDFKKPKSVSEIRTKLPPAAAASSLQNNIKSNQPSKQLSSVDTTTNKSKQLMSTSSKTKPDNNNKTRQFPPADVRPRQFPPADVRPRQFPPADVRPRQFPPADIQRPQSSKDKKRQLLLKKRRIIDDDDEEYDSEMDDFIDDGPEESEDYSKYISEIFGYDKSRYRDEDFDDRQMESNFSNILKEEYISTKIGIMEDLEDIKKEQEEKKRKAIMKKRKVL